MKKILSRSEVISCLTLDHGSWELVARAEAVYNEKSSELIAELKSELRPVPPPIHPSRPVVDWLPPDEVQREKVPLEEAFALARDIFGSWVKRMQKLVVKHLKTHSAASVI